MVQKPEHCPFRTIKTTEKAILLAVPYWLPIIDNQTLTKTNIYKELVFWCPKQNVILGKVQFKIVQKEIDKLCRKDKTLNFLAINRTIGKYTLI